MTEWVVDIAEPDALDRALVGSKALGLATMQSMGLRVPPGFVVTTAAWRRWHATGDLDEELTAAIDAGLERLTARVDRRLDDPADPLLVAVRSGGQVSMPGMLDTVLNVGLTDRTARAFRARNGGTATARHRARLGRLLGHGRSARDQVLGAVALVFASWDADRARRYREYHGIDDDLGTAAIVQVMVHGTSRGTSGSGVVFSRNPDTGERELFGDWLPDAPGEDVASGTSHPGPIDDLAVASPDCSAELAAAVRALEQRLRDLVDVEFTIEDDVLHFLQVRPGLRTPRAAARIATDLVDEGLIDRSEALERVPPATRAAIGKASVTTAARPAAAGLGICGGVVVGHLCFDPARIEDVDAPVVLARTTTSPEDVPDLSAVDALITSTGGAVSHAALVARELDLPTVVGVVGLTIDLDERGAVLGTTRVDEGTLVTVDATTGSVHLGVQAVVDGGDDTAAAGRIEAWATG